MDGKFAKEIINWQLGRLNLKRRAQKLTEEKVKMSRRLQRRNEGVYKKRKKNL